MERKIGIAKVLGGILLIVGISIGAGMLALPAATAQGGFIASAVYLLGVWIFMTLGAFFLLEANLRVPSGSNLVSMAEVTLGQWGKIVTWVVYLGLLYCLLAAYIAGGGDVVRGWWAAIGINMPIHWDIIMFVLILGGIVSLGVAAVDKVNRVIMAVKMISLFAVIMGAIFLIEPNHLGGLELEPLLGKLSLFITSFGYAIIIPSLRVYFNDDIKKLRLTILIGSLIPLVIYLIWVAIVFGVLSHAQVMYIAKSDEPITSLVAALASSSHQEWLTAAVTVFTSVCVLTAFLGVSLSLTDFLSDGLRLKRTGRSAVVLSIATFGPPLVCVWFAPSLFILGLSYAGIFCILLLTLLPALMVLFGRKDSVVAKNSIYQVWGGKFLPVTTIIASMLAIVASIYNHLV